MSLSIQIHYNLNGACTDVSTPEACLTDAKTLADAGAAVVSVMAYHYPQRGKARVVCGWTGPESASLA